MTNDPRDVIATAPMSRLQIVVVGPKALEPELARFGKVITVNDVETFR